MPIDYSKWNNINISDDEDDTHPNVDTPSLFKWRHEARVEKNKQKAVEDKQRSAQIKQAALSVKTTQQKLDAATSEEEKKKWEAQLLQETADHEAYLAKEKAIKEHEEKFPEWDVDNISKEKFDKTRINKDVVAPKAEVDETDPDSLKEFMDKHEKEAKHFGMLSKLKDTAEYMRQHIVLASPHTASYLLLWAIDLEMEKKHALAGRILHQTLIINYICEVAKTSKIDPRDATPGFFKRILHAEETNAEYLDGFQTELSALKKRVAERALVKLEEAKDELRKEEEAERAERIKESPGGLDPQEIFENLPRELQECFESRNTDKLQEVLKNMDVDEAKKHMRACADSGLWVPADRTVLE